jgi:DNA-binding NarL/FixJ family response regulator
MAVAEQADEVNATSTSFVPDDTSSLKDIEGAYDRFQKASPRPARTVNARKYHAVIVEGHTQVREMLVEYLRFSNFEVSAYVEAGQVPDQMLEDELESNPPDLFVVDLEFEAGKGASLDLIKKIKRLEKTRPAVMAMCASLSNENLIEAMKMGAEDVVPKPFDVLEIVGRMSKLAYIGRYRRDRPAGQSPSDSTDLLRQERSVFLSYSSDDAKSEGVATFLRSNIEARGIGVWYSDDILRPKDPKWAKHAFKGIRKAHVFLPLITDNYPHSRNCLAELINFYSHQLIDGSRVLLPVLHGSSEAIRNFEWTRRLIDNSHHADITSAQFLDGLIALLGRIQKAVKVHQTNKRSRL